VLVIGGGLAGLAAAVELTSHDFDVILLESKGRLGGRAGSFTDAATGQVIDACQHVSMGCCTAFADFCRTVGVDHLLKPQRDLYFLTPDGRRSRFRADPWPAPFHLGRSFASAHFLSATEKLRVAWGLGCLRLTNPAADPPFLDWLHRHRQTPRTIDRFWATVLVSALNETVDRVGLRYARKVFVDGFLSDRRGYEVQLPAVPLDRLYGDELRRWLDQRHVTVRLGTAVRSFELTGDRVGRVHLHDGERLQADWYVATVPPDRLLDLLPAEVVERHEVFRNLKNLEYSPITSVHLWFDRPVTDLPHATLLDGVGQWLFNRGEPAPGEHYVQVVISAARPLRGLGREAITDTVVAELRRLFPAARAAAVRRARVVTEHAATFSAVPGVDALRPGPVTPVANLLLAGDWTDTGWPATMEGAVRSGRRAAAVLENAARPLARPLPTGLN
jgi:squalene-associated FAD-dependent desaturase